MNIDSERLQKRLTELEVFLASEVYSVWLRSRDKEVKIYNETIAMNAKSWDEVVELRGRRDNTIDIQNSFQELSETLKTELDQAIESETQIAGNTKV